MPETVGDISFKPQQAALQPRPEAGWGIPETNLKHTREMVLFQALWEERGQGRKWMTAIRKDIRRKWPNGFPEDSLLGAGAVWIA